MFRCYRLNEAPVSGYERDVGSKTTLRITYPEGAIQKSELYEKDSLFVLSAFKPADLKWLRHIVFKEKMVGQCNRIREWLGRWAAIAYFYHNSQLNFLKNELGQILSNA